MNPSIVIIKLRNGQARAKGTKIVKLCLLAVGVSVFSVGGVAVSVVVRGVLVSVFVGPLIKATSSSGSFGMFFSFS